MTNISKLYCELQEGKITKDRFVKAAIREHSNFVSPVNSYDDIVTILKRKNIISEAHKLSTTQIIDRLSPYAVKKGIEVELAKSKKEADLDKIRDKVAKKLMSNAKAYDADQYANASDIEKKDSKQRMKVVKSELTDKDNAMKKPKGFSADKANTKASKKENRKGKPKGVKLMKENMGGDQIPQAADYKNQEVTITHDPNTKKQLDQPKTGMVKDQQGSILYVDFGDGEITPLTISLIQKPGEEPEMDKQELDNAWSNWDKTKQGKPNAMEEEKVKISEIVKKLKGYLAKRKNIKKEDLYKKKKSSSREEDDKPISLNPSDPDDKKLMNDPKFKSLYNKQQ
jgi:hypothetical protein